METLYRKSQLAFSLLRIAVYVILFSVADAISAVLESLKSLLSRLRLRLCLSAKLSSKKNTCGNITASALSKASKQVNTSISYPS